MPDSQPTSRRRSTRFQPTILTISTPAELSPPATIDIGNFFHTRSVRPYDICDGTEWNAQKYQGYETRFCTEFTRTKQAESAETTAARLKRASLLAEGWNMDDKRKSNVQAITSHQEKEMQTFTIGDTVLVAAAHALASVAVITSIWTLVDPKCPEDKEVVVKLHWFLRPGQLSTVRAKGVHKPARNEIYFSLSANATVSPLSLITHCVVSSESAAQPVLHVRRLRERFLCRLAVDNSRGLFYNFDWDDHHTATIADALPERKKGRPKAGDLEQRTNGSMWTLSGENLRPLRRRESLSRSPSPGANRNSGMHKRRRITREDNEDVRGNSAEGGATSSLSNDQSLRHGGIIKLGPGCKLRLLDPVGPPRRQLMPPARRNVDLPTSEQTNTPSPQQLSISTIQQSQASVPRQSNSSPSGQPSASAIDGARTSASSPLVLSTSSQTLSHSPSVHKATTPQVSNPPPRQQPKSSSPLKSNGPLLNRGPYPITPASRRPESTGRSQLKSPVPCRPVSPASSSPDPLALSQLRSSASSSPDPLAVRPSGTPASRSSQCCAAKSPRVGVPGAPTSHMTAPTTSRQTNSPTSQPNPHASCGLGPIQGRAAGPTLAHGALTPVPRQPEVSSRRQPDIVVPGQANSSVNRQPVSPAAFKAKTLVPCRADSPPTRRSGNHASNQPEPSSTGQPSPTASRPSHTPSINEHFDAMFKALKKIPEALQARGYGPAFQSEPSQLTTSSSRPKKRTFDDSESSPQAQSDPRMSASTTPKIAQSGPASRLDSPASPSPQATREAVTASGKSNMLPSCSVIPLNAQPGLSTTGLVSVANAGPITHSVIAPNTGSPVVQENGDFEKSVDRLLESVPAEALTGFIKATQAKFGGFGEQGARTICGAIEERSEASKRPSTVVSDLAIVSGPDTWSMAVTCPDGLRPKRVTITFEP